MGQNIKLQTQLLRSSPNTDGFYAFYISQGSVATQPRCRGMFSNHFTTNFLQNAPVKNLENRSLFGKKQRYGQNFVAYFWGATLYGVNIFSDRNMNSTIVCRIRVFLSKRKVNQKEKMYTVSRNTYLAVKLVILKTVFFRVLATDLGFSSCVDLSDRSRVQKDIAYMLLNK